MDKYKKTLIIGGIIEGAILIFALIVSILVLTTSHSAQQYPLDWQAKNMENGPMIGYFQNTPMAFFFIIVLPILIMVAVDLVYFIVIAQKKESKLSDSQLEAIKKQAEEEVRAEMMKELLEEAKQEKKEEEK